MYNIGRMILVVMLVTAAFAQSPEPPLSDTRLSIHTLVREDIFAGFLADDLERFSRGEKNIDRLLEMRPGSRAELLAWKGGATMYRAVKAYENKNNAEFRKKYNAAVEMFAEAHKLNADSPGVSATTGGSYSLMADRLPEDKRASAWSEAYDNYLALWEVQGQMVDKLPVHIRGELLAGLAQSAQRTGRNAEMNKYLDKILEVLSDTPYEPIAKKWKSDPKSAATSSITCMTCHDPGKLTARLAALNKQ